MRKPHMDVQFVKTNGYKFYFIGVFSSHNGKIDFVLVTI